MGILFNVYEQLQLDVKNIVLCADVSAIKITLLEIKNIHVNLIKFKVSEEVGTD